MIKDIIGERGTLDGDKMPRYSSPYASLLSGSGFKGTQPATFAGRGCFPALSLIFLFYLKLFVTSSFSNGKKKPRNHIIRFRMHAFVAEIFYLKILKRIVGSFCYQIWVYIVLPYGYVKNKKSRTKSSPNLIKNCFLFRQLIRAGLHQFLCRFLFGEPDGLEPHLHEEPHHETPWLQGLVEDLLLLHGEY